MYEATFGDVHGADDDALAVLLGDEEVVPRESAGGEIGDGRAPREDDDAEGVLDVEEGLDLARMGWPKRF